MNWTAPFDMDVRFKRCSRTPPTHTGSLGEAARLDDEDFADALENIRLEPGADKMKLSISRTFGSGGQHMLFKRLTHLFGEPVGNLWRKIPQIKALVPLCFGWT